MQSIYLASVLMIGVAQAPDEAPQPVPPPPVPALPAIAPELLAPQPIYGPVVRIQPAHRIALVEAGAPMFRSDPRVREAAALLSETTGVYVEDASRIAELTVRVCLEIRATKRPASPVEMLEGALQWKSPASSQGAVFRQFEEFAALYRKLRVKEGKDHKAAMATIRKAPGR